MRSLLRMSVATAAILLLAGGAQASSLFDVTYETEAPGMQNTSASLSVGGVETFDEQPTTGSSSAAGGTENFTTDFGTNGAIKGTYSNVQIANASEYGGAGGTGKYAVAFQSTPYTLSLSSANNGGVNYFGFWLSALDKGNYVSFYDNNKLLFTFNPQDVINAIDETSNSKAYYGNPNKKFQGQDASEPFVFLNFFATNGETFNKIVFSEDNYGGGYESDNQTVGNWTNQGTGTQVQLKLSADAPEPAGWALMITGVGLLGSVARRRRAASFAPA